MHAGSTTRRSLLAMLGSGLGLALVGCAPQAAGGAMLSNVGRAGSGRRADDDGFHGGEQPAPEPAASNAEPPQSPPAPEPPAKPRRPTLDLPARTPGAETGSAFLERTEGLGRAAMDEAVAQAILEGNVPDYLRTLAPIRLEARGLVATLHVACDYLAIGSDDDFVRMPMTAAAAQRIANRLGATLPTPKLVDTIYEHAEVRLPPSFIEGGPTEGTLADYALHHRKLETHRLRGGHPLGVLTAGHKKDIVLCERLVERPDRVAIYGWHRRAGDVIQPVSTLHSCRYADYSHGVRLVDQRLEVGGELLRLSDALRDPEWAWLLSSEGPLSVTAYPTTLPDYDGRGRTKRRKNASRAKKKG